MVHGLLSPAVLPNIPFVALYKALMTGDVAGLYWVRKLSGALGKEALGDVKGALAFKQTNPRPCAQMFPNFFARWFGFSKEHFEFVGVFPDQVVPPP